jgi:hypothetical protein
MTTRTATNSILTSFLPRKQGLALEINSTKYGSINLANPEKETTSEPFSKIPIEYIILGINIFAQFIKTVHLMSVFTSKIR